MFIRLSVFLFLIFSSPVEDEMIKIPGGYYKTFIKSQGKDSVRVKSFYLNSYPVTNKEFLEFVKSNPTWSRSKIKRVFADANYLRHWKNNTEIYKELEDCPVTNVSWFAAKAFCLWKNKRLPTMIEWDYAADFPIINSNASTKDIILDWYSKPSTGTLARVGSGYQNKLGLNDMHGLIWEWVSDFNVMTSDSRISKETNNKYYCGGGNVLDSQDYAKYMRFAFRSSLKASYCNNRLGFRCAKDM